MEDYKIYRKMYLCLFNCVTDVLSFMDCETEAAKKLIEAQQKCEELYINAGEEN